MLHRCGERLDIERTQRARIDDLALDAVLGERLRRVHARPHHLRPRDQRDVFALALDVGDADRDQVIACLGVGHFPRRVVERLALDEHDRVVVADRGLQQALRVVRGRRHHDLEARHVRVEALERLAVLRADLHRRTTRPAEHDRHVILPAAHLIDLRRVVDDLIDRDEREVERHELDDRPQPDHRGADADAGKAHLRDRRVDDAALAEPLQHALRDLVRAVVVADLFAHHEHVGVALHLFAHRLVERFAVADDAHGLLLHHVLEVLVGGGRCPRRTSRRPRSRL